MENNEFLAIVLLILFITLYLAVYKQREDFSCLKRRVMGYANLSDGSSEKQLATPLHQHVAVSVAKQVLSVINKTTKNSYQLINFDQISVDEKAVVENKPATRYTLDLFVSQKGFIQGSSSGITKRLIIVFSTYAEDTTNKPTGDPCKPKAVPLKAVVETVNIANSEPYPNKIFMDDNDIGDDLIITDSLIKPSPDITIMGVNDSTIPFTPYKSCEESGDNYKNGGSVDCSKKYNFQEPILPACLIQERQQMNSIINNKVHENQHARWLYHQSQNHFGKCMNVKTNLNIGDVRNQGKNDWLFQQARRNINYGHGQAN